VGRPVLWTVRILLVGMLCLAACAERGAAPQTVNVDATPANDASIANTAKATGAIADDPSRSDDERCADAFDTFRTKIHPGDDAATVRAAIGPMTWIGSDNPVDVVGGHVPVEMSFTDQTVVFMCLSKPNPKTENLPWSRWVIYARLEGRSSPTFGAFLRAGGSKKLIEYALCHSPDDQHSDCEHFPKR